ncbi:MAG TPA: hypothetical protein VMH90_02195, partial [Thermoplasmata archaeon]|nr:hypothetical protein [Thermoplasmata archaeon]
NYASSVFHALAEMSALKVPPEDAVRLKIVRGAVGTSILPPKEDLPPGMRGGRRGGPGGRRGGPGGRGGPGRGGPGRGPPGRGPPTGRGPPPGGAPRPSGGA